MTARVAGPPTRLVRSKPLLASLLIEPLFPHLPGALDGDRCRDAKDNGEHNNGCSDNLPSTPSAIMAPAPLSIRPNRQSWADVVGLGRAAISAANEKTTPAESERIIVGSSESQKPAVGDTVEGGAPTATNKVEPQARSAAAPTTVLGLRPREAPWDLWAIRGVWLTPAFTCKARLNDCSRSEHTSAPCLVQRLVRRRRDDGCASHGFVSDRGIS